MIVEDLHDAIADLLTTDPTFIAALTAAFAVGGAGLPQVPMQVLSNRPLAELQQLHADLLPCWVMEPMNAAVIASEGSDFGVTIGAGQQEFRHRIVVSLVWTETDRDAAYRQRLRIPEMLVQLFLRNPTLGLADCTGCLITASEPDQGGAHPFQLLSAEITGDIVINRS
jgi:hypothetical protein